jgi:hypothetical protein
MRRLGRISFYDMDRSPPEIIKVLKGASSLSFAGTYYASFFIFFLSFLP